MFTIRVIQWIVIIAILCYFIFLSTYGTIRPMNSGRLVPYSHSYANSLISMLWKPSDGVSPDSASIDKFAATMDIENSDDELLMGLPEGTANPLWEAFVEARSASDLPSARFLAKQILKAKKADKEKAKSSANEETQNTNEQSQQTESENTAEESDEAAPSVEELQRNYPEARYTPEGFIELKGFLIPENYRFEGEGCDMSVGQCSASKDRAVELCMKLKGCQAATCFHKRNDCQLRTDPVEYDITDQPRDIAIFRSYSVLKNAKDRSIPVLQPPKIPGQKRDWRREGMEPGKLAPPGFNHSGVCGENGFKCVVSYGLYGGNPKYTEGAISNAELVKKIFPGWIVRIYHDHTVPQHILDRLHSLDAELILVDNIGGGIAGMFWRFLVAEDMTVDRWAVRDSDSRLNEREKAAVDEWIESGYSVHTIRDHPNHDRPLNGGMWGGIKGSVIGIRDLVSSSNRDGYGADLDFLNGKVWPRVERDQIGHDSYSCWKYRNSYPFPTKRPDDFQHVGQVFENNQPRISDIDCCMRDTHNPRQCRYKKEWLYG